MYKLAVRTDNFLNVRTIKLFLLLFLCFFFVSFKVDPHLNPAFIVTTKDSVEYKVIINKDNENKPINYKSKIKAPVCEDGLCYDVELIVYWNLVGSFERFEILPNKPLTKLKHEPFTASEYDKLTSLLKSPAPTLSKYKKEELITKIQHIDGVSGATVTAVKDETIPGAVYTCFTLWHLVHGQVVDSIQKQTAQHLTKDVVTKIIDYKTVEGDYYLLNYLSDKQFQSYLSDILPLSIRNNWYFSKQFFEKMPEVLVSMPDFQEYFGANFSKIEYYGQLSLLNRLQHKIISGQLATALISNISGNTIHSELSLRVLSFNSGLMEDSVLKLLVNRIVSQSIRVNPEVFNQLSTVLKSRKALKPELKTFKKTSRI